MSKKEEKELEEKDTMPEETAAEENETQPEEKAPEKSKEEELAEKLKGLLCHVNLIPVNDVKERDYVRSTNEAVKRFEGILTSRGIETTVRRKLGSDIDAACGQLRKRYKDEKR